MRPRARNTFGRVPACLEPPPSSLDAMVVVGGRGRRLEVV